MKKKRLIAIILACFILGLFTIGAIYAYRKINENKEVEITLDFKSKLDDINEFKYGEYFATGWLQVQGTNVDLPILTPFFETEVRDGKINPDFDYSWYNPNYKSSENRRVFMGHNILNVSSKPLRNSSDLRDFESLLEFVYYDFAKDNLYIKYSHDDIEEIYLIYAISFYNYADDNGESISKKDELDKYISGSRKDSLYDYDIDVDSSDTLIALTTCSRFFGNNYRNQFRIDARKLRDNEKIIKYNVKENDNYKVVEDKLFEEN